MLIVALEKKDGRLMTQINFKMVDMKEEVGTRDANTTKDGKNA